VILIHREKSDPGKAERLMKECGAIEVIEK
jgi:hypothetical protein